LWGLLGRWVGYCGVY